MLSTLTPISVVHHHLNHTGQNILTIGSWVLTVVLLGVAARLGRRESNTPFYVLMVLASMVAAFAEPLYDVAFSLYFYSTHGMQHTITAFGIPQPIWAYSGYAVLYAAPAIYIVRKMQQGALDRRSLLPVAGVILLMSCVFEIVGINVGTYTYWGPHVLRIAKYPIVIGVLETAQVISFGIAAGLLRQRAKTTAGLFGVFPLFPMTFFGANFGAGAAVIIGIHLQHHTTFVVTILTLVSIGCAAAMIRAASSFLPEGEQAQPAPAGDPVTKLSGIRPAV
jgi:hypothetical protein